MEEIMGLEKAIEHGKEKRKAYRGAKAVDSTCRNHGSVKIIGFTNRIKQAKPIGRDWLNLRNKEERPNEIKKNNISI